MNGLGYALSLRVKNLLRAWQLNAISSVQRPRNLPVNQGIQGIDLTCRHCGGTLQLLGNIPVTHPGLFENRDYCLVLCTACEVVCLDPLPSPADLEVLYCKSPQFTTDHYLDSAKANRTLRSYGRRLDYLNLVPAAGEAVLEIGAGLAWISKACKERSTAVRTVAQDISGECAQSCPWVDEYIVGSIDSMPETTLFSLVSMTHVIEHLPDPAEIFVAVRSKLRPRGNVYITAPFRPAFWHPRKGIEPWLRYSYLHVPAHINYLSRRWLESHATASGLELVHWDDTHDGHQVFEAVLRRSA